MKAKPATLIRLTSVVTRSLSACMAYPRHRNDCIGRAIAKPGFALHQVEAVTALVLFPGARGGVARVPAPWLGDEHAAEGLLQDSFIKAMCQGRGFCRRDNPRAWLFRAACNAMTDRLRAAWVKWRSRPVPEVGAAALLPRKRLPHREPLPARSPD